MWQALNSHLLHARCIVKEAAAPAAAYH